MRTRSRGSRAAPPPGWATFDGREVLGNGLAQQLAFELWRRGHGNGEVTGQSWSSAHAIVADPPAVTPATAYPASADLPFSNSLLTVKNSSTSKRKTAASGTTIASTVITREAPASKVDNNGLPKPPVASEVNCRATVVRPWWLLRSSG